MASRTVGARDNLESWNIRFIGVLRFCHIKPASPPSPRPSSSVPSGIQLASGSCNCCAAASARWAHSRQNSDSLGRHLPAARRAAAHRSRGGTPRRHQRLLPGDRRRGLRTARARARHHRAHARGAPGAAGEVAASDRLHMPRRSRPTPGGCGGGGRHAVGARGGCCCRRWAQPWSGSPAVRCSGPVTPSAPSFGIRASERRSGSIA